MCRAWYTPLIVFVLLLLTGFLFLPTGPMAADLPTPTPWPTPTPSPVRVVCLTCTWAQEVRSLEASIANKCTDTPERAANPHECRGMRQVINLRKSNLGGTRAGVPVYIFRIGDSMLHRELTLPQVQGYWKASSGRDRQKWTEVIQLMENYERTRGN